MPALLLSVVMAWAGWSWIPWWSTAWWLAELPAAVFAVGLLLRDRPLAMAAYFARIAAAERTPRVPPPPRFEEDAPEVEVVYVRDEQSEVAAVVSLQGYRERKAA